MRTAQEAGSKNPQTKQAVDPESLLRQHANALKHAQRLAAEHKAKLAAGPAADAVTAAASRPPGTQQPARHGGRGVGPTKEPASARAAHSDDKHLLADMRDAQAQHPAHAASAAAKRARKEDQIP